MADELAQVDLFPVPPFDFEEAYDELHRLDQRAKNRKAAWESLKGAARDAKEDYDAAINDLHQKFDEMESARRRVLRAPNNEGGDDTEASSNEPGI